MAAPSPPWLVGKHLTPSQRSRAHTTSGFATVLLVPLRATCTVQSYVHGPLHALVAYQLHCPIEAFRLAYRLTPCAFPTSDAINCWAIIAPPIFFWLRVTRYQTIPSQLVRVPVALPDPRIQRRSWVIASSSCRSHCVHITLPNMASRFDASEPPSSFGGDSTTASCSTRLPGQLPQAGISAKIHRNALSDTAAPSLQHLH